MKNNKEILISVIIPCYNVEKYITKCLDSLINQKLNKIELIIVEDCSTDNTKEIINKYLEDKDKSNIIYIKNESNYGLAKSRNIGVSYSSGKYIGFIDSDDYVSDLYYKDLYNGIVENKADVAICDMNIVYENKNNHTVLSKVTNGGTKAIDFVNNGLAASACNKLFKRELIESFPFLEGKINEDVAAIIPAIVNAKKIAYVPSVQYNYIQRGNSIQNSSISFKRFDIFDAVDLCLNRIKNHPNYIDFERAIIYNQIIMFFIYIIPKEPSFIKRYKLLKEFNRLANKYKIRKNPLLWKFLEGQGRYHKYYYKALLKLNCNNFSFLSSILISSYIFYKNKFIKSVIKNDITFEHLIKLSKKQAKLKDNDFNISVVVPNYNYEIFMIQRLYSILNQRVKISEIIVLDDCSTDSSRQLIDVICNDLSKYINIRKVYNEINSGSAFKQWEKGFNLANGNYVWIAEADDYCDKNFLKNIVKPIKKNKDIVISYADTAFVDADGKIILRTIKPEIDIMKTGHWDKSYINDGLDEIKNYTYLNCTIANVSSAIIKKGDYDNYFKMSGEYKQAGDWLFYVNIMTHGKISYYNKPLNYYRVHGNNVSSTTKKNAHMEEIKKIHDYYNKKFKLNKKQLKNIKKRYSFLKRVWEI